MGDADQKRALEDALIDICQAVIQWQAHPPSVKLLASLAQQSPAALQALAALLQRPAEGLAPSGLARWEAAPEAGFLVSLIFFQTMSWCFSLELALKTTPIVRHRHPFVHDAVSMKLTPLQVPFLIRFFSDQLLFIHACSVSVRISSQEVVGWVLTANKCVLLCQ